MFRFYSAAKLNVLLLFAHGQLCLRLTNHRVFVDKMFINDCIFILNFIFETLITFLTIENNNMNNYIVTFEYRVMVTAFAILAMFNLTAQ